MAEIKRTKTAEQALRTLMNTCAKCEKCTADARRSLYRWGVDPDEHAGILRKLTEQKFIDDRRYAAAYVREKANLSRWGSYKIRTALRAKQIAEEVIAEALSQIDGRTMASKLEEQLRRKMRNTTAKNNYELRGKLLRYGTALGFDFDQVSDLIDKLIDTE